MLRVFVRSLVDGRVLHDRLFRTEAEAQAYVDRWKDDPTVFSEWYRVAAKASQWGQMIRPPREKVGGVNV